MDSGSLRHCYAHSLHYPRATHSCCSFSVINAAGKTGNFGSKMPATGNWGFFLLEVRYCPLTSKWNSSNISAIKGSFKAKHGTHSEPLTEAFWRVSWGAACSALLSFGISHQQSTERGVQWCPSLGATQAGHGTWQRSTAPPEDKGRHPPIQKQTSADDGGLSHAHERRLWSITGLVKKCRLTPTEPHPFSAPACLWLPKLVGKSSLQAYLRISCLRICCR